MQRCVSLALAVGAAGQQECHSLSASIADSWCNQNCNHEPPNCPASLCDCDAPAPTPSPSPTPPSPSPAPSPTPAPTPPAVDFPIFQLDLFMNDPADGWQATGFPDYLLTDAAKYMNVAGISFIQPSDLMNDAYDLPAEVGNAVNILRGQGVQVQLLVGGQISSGWNALQGNPQKASSNAIKLMKKYDCGIQVDNESGGDSAGTIEFIKLCYEGKPATVNLSMDVGGTPSGDQRTVIAGAIDYLQFVNMMVSSPQYDQQNSVNFGHQFGIPYEKITVAYYAGTWVDNCNHMGEPGNCPAMGGPDCQTLGYGNSLVHKMGLKGLSIWAVGGASYANCPAGKDGPQGFAETMVALGAHTLDESEVQV